MNCGCRLYRPFYQMDLTYAMDCLLNSVTDMNVAFLFFSSSVRIPNYINNFRSLIPAVRLRPLNLLSASSVNLHGLANTSIFHNNPGNVISVKITSST